MFDATHKAITEAGLEITIGSEIVDFRGTPWIFAGISRHPADRSATSGKIIVTDVDDPFRPREFYAHIFDLHIEPRG